MSDKQCMGACLDGHLGPVVRVNVVDPKDGKDWGDFWYCQEAIEEDKRHGFIVERIDSGEYHEWPER